MKIMVIMKLMVIAGLILDDMAKKTTLICLSLFLLPLCLFASSEADGYLGKNRLKYFNKLVSELTNSQIISDDGLKNLGTTWNRELARSKVRFLSARTKNDVYYALLSLQKTLHDAHSKLKTSNSFLPTEKPIELPIKFRAEYNNGKYEYAVIESNDNSLPAGSILTSVDGKTPDQIEYEFMEWLNGNSMDYLRAETAKWLSFRDPKNLPSPDIGTATVYEFAEQGSGKVIKRIYKWSEYQQREENKGGYRKYNPEFFGLNYIVYSTTRPDTKIIRYFSFYYKYSSTELWNKLSSLSYRPHTISKANDYPWTELEKQDQAQLFGYLRSKRVKAILLDLRENGGGSFNPDFVGHFTNKPFNVFTRQLYYRPIFKRNPELLSSVESGSDFMKKNVSNFFINNPSALRSPLYPYECRTDECKPDEAIYEPDSLAYKITLNVLTGPYCISSCDHFVAVIKDNKIGKILGLPSQGGDAPFTYDVQFSLADRIKFSITTSVGETYRMNDLPLEAHPANVDILIHQTKDNRDNYVQEALSKITH